ncbi:CBS domain-containing protein [Haloechinothrix sp. YIM 98757]|uniref:CBS domain-containing protein n=1 Tax=Haloechinothrix aidingensis TaxID=2752311 RepID=A0A838ABY7_9PSEU|nr:CBS domain-containing protein [Haloechinothrix aidingensis]MBA0126741.1 CBS domain-containing protein [Haloechinothrix aidingensis]
MQTSERYCTRAHTLGAETQLGAEFAQHTAAEVMVTRPKTLPIDTSLEEARAIFDDDLHVRMLLLVDDGVLHGTLLRTDLLSTRAPTDLALPLARLTDRTTNPDERIIAIHERLVASGRRLAVIDTNHRLLGLLCLKRHQSGFCSDEGIMARAREREAAGRPAP